LITLCNIHKNTVINRAKLVGNNIIYQSNIDEIIHKHNSRSSDIKTMKPIAPECRGVKVAFSSH